MKSIFVAIGLSTTSIVLVAGTWTGYAPVPDSYTSAPPALNTQASTAAIPRLNGGEFFIDNFAKHRKGIWKISHGWRNGDWTVNDWRRSQVTFGDKLRLTLGRKQTDLARFSGGELQTKRNYGHGHYEVKMRAAPASGTVSGFFTYTGPPFGQPWDEIDVEILGAKPREVMFTYFRDGEKISHKHPLGFDATAETHIYGFDWQPNYIRWYVDGEMAHQVTGQDLPLPITKQKLMVSLWGSRQLKSWVGPFNPASLPTTMDIDCISFSPNYAMRKSCT